MLITEADLTTRYSAEILRQWADDDNDGTADSAILQSAITKASSRIETALKPAYPAQVPFSADNVPEILKGICLDFCGLMLAGRQQDAAEHYRKTYNDAQELLKNLTIPGACLLYADGTTVYCQGSSQAEPNTGAWSSNTAEDRDSTFTDSSLKDF